MKTRTLFLAIIGVLVLIISMLPACSKGSETSSQSQTSQPISTSTSSSQTIVSSTSKTGTTSSTAQNTKTSSQSGPVDIADIKSLSSYRLSIKTHMIEGPGAGTTSTMKYEWVRDQKAEHAWMEDSSGKISELFISIGEKRWIWAGTWIEQPGGFNPGSPSQGDLASQIKQAQQNLNDSGMKIVNKGSETVNNVKCIRYEFDYRISMDVPEGTSGKTSKTDVHSSGDVWVADQAGLAAVMIKSISRSEMMIGGVKSVVDAEQNLTDIGASITINPPGSSQSIPSIPSLPSMPSMPPIPTGIPDIPGK